MLEHDLLQHQIPEYLAGTLAEADKAPLDAHLGACRSCAGIVRHWRAILPELGAVADASQAPHPDPPRLLAVASGSKDPVLLRHLESCPRCALELAVWSRRAASPVSVPAATSRFAWSRRTGIAAVAASLVLGAGLATVAHSLLLPASSPRTRWSGTAPLLVLEGVLRGDRPAPTAALAANQPYLPLAVVPALEPSIADDERLWLGLGPAGSSGTVWETTVAVAEIRRQVRESGAVTFLIPADGLGEGEYLLRTRRGGTGRTEFASELPFRVVRDAQRQSPAATKPPQ
jgi:anti-sigma factor RsiW